jgi:hypothetical protein
VLQPVLRDGIPGRDAGTKPDGARVIRAEGCSVLAWNREERDVADHAFGQPLADSPAAFEGAG